MLQPSLLRLTCVQDLERFVREEATAWVWYDTQHGGCIAAVDRTYPFLPVDLQKYLKDVVVPTATQNITETSNNSSYN
jgi:hypothetical protein